MRLQPELLGKGDVRRLHQYRAIGKDDRRNDALAVVEPLDQAQAIGVLVDVHERIRDAVLAEELLGPFTILAPRRAVHTYRSV